MRSPWVGSLALLAPAHGFVAQPSLNRGSISMLQMFARPSASAVRTLSSRGWKQDRLLRPAGAAGVKTVPKARAVRMAGDGNGGGGGAKGKKEKVKKPESYYKQTVILPQTEFQQVHLPFHSSLPYQYIPLNITSAKRHSYLYHETTYLRRSRVAKGNVKSCPRYNSSCGFGNARRKRHSSNEVFHVVFRFSPYRRCCHSSRILIDRARQHVRPRNMTADKVVRCMET